MQPTNDTITVGSVISGTLRTQDLIPRFISVLEELGELYTAQTFQKEIPDSIWENEDSWYWMDPFADELLQELFDTLNDLAPEGYYFGAHPGDGSDFGFWPTDMLD